MIRRLLPSLAALLLPVAAGAQEQGEAPPEPIELEIDFATIQQATDLERAGDVDGALAALDAGIAAHPGDATLVASRGAVLLRRGDLDGARAAFDQAVAVNSDDPSGFAGQCWFAVHDGKVGLADDTCSAARTRNLADPIYRQVGVTAGMLLNEDELASAQTLDSLVNANPYVPGLRIVSLESNLRTDRFAMAKGDLDMARQMFQPRGGVPRIVDRIAWFKLADITGADLDCYLEGAALKIAEAEGATPAIETLERLAACRPGDAAFADRLVQHHNAEGLAARTRGEFPTAVEHFRAALALRPADPVLWSNLAVAAFEGQDLATAEEGLRKVLELTPDDAEARRNYGVVLKLQGRDAEARPYLEGAATQ